MELYAQILQNILEKNEIVIRFPDLRTDITTVFKLECYQTLRKIKAVIEDDSLDDETCFTRIEEIINIFEEIGSDCGGRHDFG